MNEEIRERGGLFLLQPDPLTEVALRIASLPRFEAAAHHYTKSLAEWRRGSRLINKLSSSHARNQIVHNLVFLHFAADPANPEDGATYSRLLELVQRRKDCSKRVLITIITLLTLGDFIEIRILSHRRKAYIPTEKLIEFMRNWYAIPFGCFDFLISNSHYASKISQDPIFLRQVILDVGHAYHDLDIKLIANFPDLYLICSLDSGFTTVAALALCVFDQKPFPKPAAIAEQFASSTSQVRNIIKALASQKLISLDEKGAVVDAMALTERLKEYIARELALYAKYALKWDACETNLERLPIS